MILLLIGLKNNQINKIVCMNIYISDFRIRHDDDGDF